MGQVNFKKSKKSYANYPLKDKFFCLGEILF